MAAQEATVANKVAAPCLGAATIFKSTVVRGGYARLCGKTISLLFVGRHSAADKA